MFISYALIILGVVFLLKNLGIISSSVWGIIWPLILFNRTISINKSSKI